MTDFYDDIPDPSPEAFYGFEMTDEQVGEGAYRPVALELKHLFEHLFREAEKANEELSLSVHFQQVLTDFLWRPGQQTLARVLAASPSMHASIVEVTRLVAPSLLKDIPPAE